MEHEREPIDVPVRDSEPDKQFLSDTNRSISGLEVELSSCRTLHTSESVITFQILDELLKMVAEVNWESFSFSRENRAITPVIYMHSERT